VHEIASGSCSVTGFGINVIERSIFTVKETVSSLVTE